MAMNKTSKFEAVPVAPMNEYTMSHETAQQYLKTRVLQLREDGQVAAADLVEAAMEQRINQALVKLAYEVGSGKLTIRL